MDHKSGIDSDTGLDELLQVGNTLRLFFYEGNPNNCLWHIREIVDDVWIVYRYWSYRGKRWIYQIESKYLFMLHYKDGSLTLDKKGEK